MGHVNSKTAFRTMSEEKYSCDCGNIQTQKEALSHARSATHTRLNILEQEIAAGLETYRQRNPFIPS